MERKLIAIDLDGTTLNNQSKIALETKDILKKLRNKGHIVSIATGRPYRTSHFYYKELGLDTPIVNFNGAWCHNPKKNDWENSYHKGLDRDLALRFLALENNKDIQLISAESKDTIYANGQYIPYPDFYPEGQKDVQHFSSNTLLEDPTSVNIFSDNIQLQPKIKTQVAETFGDDVEIRSWGGFAPCLEVVSAGVQKALGVEAIADYYGIKQKDIVAYGDEDNDYEMIQYAGVGIAMKNGISSLKEISDDVTKVDNHENGLAKHLKELFRLTV